MILEFKYLYENIHVNNSIHIYTINDIYKYIYIYIYIYMYINDI